MSLTEDQEISGSIRLNKIKTESLWRNWQLASLLCSVAISFIGFGLVMPLRTLYARAEGATGGETGLMAAAFMISGFIFLFPFGWLSDRISRVALIIGGLAAHFLITLAYLPATTPEMFIALRFIEGISTAAVMPSARAMLADLTPHGRNGEAFGMLNAMMTFGMFAGPMIGTALAEWFGYQFAYIISALIFLPAILMVAISLRHYHAGQKARASATAEFKTQEKLFNRYTVLGCVIRGAISLGPGVAASVWSLYMADLGYGLIWIGMTYTVYAIPMVLVAPYAGRWSDRYGRLGLMFGGSILLSLCWISYGLFPALLFVLIMGMVEGSLDAVARSANDGYLADYTPPGSLGKAQGLFNAVFQLGNLTGAVLGGYLYELGHAVPFIVLGSLQLVVVLATLGLSPLVHRPRMN